MREIPLTQGKIALVDDEDYERLSKFKWQYNNQRNSVHRSFRADIPSGMKVISMQNEILQTDNLIDHKDHNGLNNRKSNLRICTTSQNGQNRRKQAGKASSKYKGVSFESRLNKWRADIRLRDIFGNRFKRSLGFFLNEEDAAKVYDDEARKEFGEFAALNFPEEGETSCL